MGMLLEFEKGHNIFTNVMKILKVANDMKQYELTPSAMIGHVHELLQLWLLLQ
jgi:hypothetical protein